MSFNDGHFHNSNLFSCSNDAQTEEDDDSLSAYDSCREEEENWREVGSHADDMGNSYYNDDSIHFYDANTSHRSIVECRDRHDNITESSPIPSDITSTNSLQIPLVFVDKVSSERLDSTTTDTDGSGAAVVIDRNALIRPIAEVADSSSSASIGSSSGNRLIGYPGRDQPLSWRDFEGFALATEHLPYHHFTEFGDILDEIEVLSDIYESDAASDTAEKEIDHRVIRAINKIARNIAKDHLMAKREAFFRLATHRLSRGDLLSLGPIPLAVRALLKSNEDTLWDIFNFYASRSKVSSTSSQLRAKNVVGSNAGTTNSNNCLSTQSSTAATAVATRRSVRAISSVEGKTQKQAHSKVPLTSSSAPRSSISYAFSEDPTDVTGPFGQQPTTLIPSRAVSVNSTKISTTSPKKRAAGVVCSTERFRRRILPLSDFWYLLRDFGVCPGLCKKSAVCGLLSELLTPQKCEVASSDALSSSEIPLPNSDPALSYYLSPIQHVNNEGSVFRSPECLADAEFVVSQNLSEKDVEGPFSMTVRDSLTVSPSNSGCEDRHTRPAVVGELPSQHVITSPRENHQRPTMSRESSTSSSKGGARSSPRDANKSSTQEKAVAAVPSSTGVTPLGDSNPFISYDIFLKLLWRISVDCLRLPEDYCPRSRLLAVLKRMESSDGRSKLNKLTADVIPPFAIFDYFSERRAAALLKGFVLPSVNHHTPRSTKQPKRHQNQANLPSPTLTSARTPSKNTGPPSVHTAFTSSAVGAPTCSAPTAVQPDGISPEDLRAQDESCKAQGVEPMTSRSESSSKSGKAAKTRTSDAKSTSTRRSDNKTPLHGTVAKYVSGVDGREDEKKVTSAAKKAPNAVAAPKTKPPMVIGSGHNTTVKQSKAAQVDVRSLIRAAASSHA